MFTWNRLSSLLRLFIGFSILATTSLLLCLLLLFFLPWRGVRIRMANRYGQLVGPLILWIAGAKLRLRNPERLDPNRPAIYLSNHSTNLDPLIAISICPVGGCGVSKKELARVLGFGQAYLLSGHLLIDRSNRERAIASMKSLTDLVKKHLLSIWIWPEGTRSKDGRLLPFKKGFAHIAVETGLPIVPIIVHQGHKLWAARSLTLHSGTVDVEVLEPIQTTEWSVENLDQHIEEIQNIYNAAMQNNQKMPN